LNLLVTNDDGIEAAGIRHLAEALSAVAKVYVVAPHAQRSACGHGITIGRPVIVERVSFPGADMAFSLEGTPADCVKMGVEVLRAEGVSLDMVFSGINHGGNLGTDVIYSGTAAAALEGAISGLPSVALSIAAREPADFSVAREVAVQATRADIASIDPTLVLNINIPDLPKERIHGAKVVRLGQREYDKWYEKTTLPDGRMAYVYSGYPIRYDGLTCESCDVGAHQEGYISVTPLHFDLTGYSLLEKVRADGIEERFHPEREGQK
jgi:5'-nucleotidase